MNNKFSYLMGSGLMDDTLLFVRAMAWGADDLGYSSTGWNTLPRGSHQMIYVDEKPLESWGDISYSGFEYLGQNYPTNVSTYRGYLATFLEPTISGFMVRERWRFDTFGSAEAATGLRDKLIEQPPNTLLILTTNDEPSTNKEVFQHELEQHWGAEHLDDLDWRSSYILVSAKNRKKIYETFASGGSGVEGDGDGPIGFCGWINKSAYNTGLRYVTFNKYHDEYIPLDFASMHPFRSTEGVTGDVFYPSGAADPPSGLTIHYAGFFKATQAGTYYFRLKSDNTAYVWLGPVAASQSGDAESFASESLISTDWDDGYRTGIVELNANTYYPFRVIYGEGLYDEFLELNVKYENEDYQNIGPYLYHSDYWAGEYIPYGNAPQLIRDIRFDMSIPFKVTGDFNYNKTIEAQFNVDLQTKIINNSIIRNVSGALFNMSLSFDQTGINFSRILNDAVFNIPINTVSDAYNHIEEIITISGSGITAV